MNAIREKIDVRDVKAEIAKVHRRLNLQLRSVDEEYPKERTESEEGKKTAQNPDRQLPIFREGRLFRGRRIVVDLRIRSSEISEQSKRRREDERGERDAGAQAAKDHAEEQSADC